MNDEIRDDVLVAQVATSLMVDAAPPRALSMTPCPRWTTPDSLDAGWPTCANHRCG